MKAKITKSKDEESGLCGFSHIKYPYMLTITGSRKEISAVREFACLKLVTTHMLQTAYKTIEHAKYDINQLKKCKPKT